MAFEAQARESDTILESRGVRLYVDPFSLTYLEGASIDYQDSPEGFPAAYRDLLAAGGSNWPGFCGRRGSGSPGWRSGWLRWGTSPA